MHNYGYLFGNGSFKKIQFKFRIYSDKSLGPRQPIQYAIQSVFY